MDEYADKPGEILFFTGTLPGSGSEQFEAIARWSSWIVHRLKAWIARRVDAKLDFYAWELQKRGALHLHYALHVPDDAARFEIRTQIKNEWIRLLDSVSGFTGVDLYHNSHRGFSHRSNTDLVQADCQEVEKSVGAYLGKYLSKGSRGKNSTDVFHPCRWYGVSRPLRAYEESLRRSITLTFPSVVGWVDSIDVLKNLLSLTADCAWDWLNKVMPGFGGVSYGVSVDTLDELLQLHFGERMKYASINAKVRDKWRDLIREIQRLEIQNPKWWEAMQRRHPSVSRWPEVSRLSGMTLTTPEGMEKAQHFTWGLEDLLRDGHNTWKPRLERHDKSRMIYLVSQVNAALMLHYEIDLKEFSNDDC